MAKLVEDQGVKAPNPWQKLLPNHKPKLRPEPAAAPNPNKVVEEVKCDEPREVMTEEKILKLTEAKNDGYGHGLPDRHRKTGRH